MNKHALFIFMLMGLLSCGKGPETVLITSDPLSSAAGNDTTRTTIDSTDNDFVQLRIGEQSAIESLDPLFAESYSELRVINLLYDGLTQLDEEGNAEPALASAWEVNEDSTRYILRLRPDVSFYNSTVFEEQNGRRFLASDVPFIFERMASAHVPARAAEMFKDITGFSSYQNEQSFVKNPAQRVYTKIEGIVVPDDSTVIFNFNRPSPGFLINLAHPLASVYAKESAGGAPPIQIPAGTGPFYFIQKEGNRIILGVNSDYTGDQPQLSRIDIISGSSERDLFGMFTNGDLDIIIEPSPSTITSVTDSTGEITMDYENDFVLDRSRVDASYSIYYNQASRQQNVLNSFFSTLDTTDFLKHPLMGHITYLPEVENEQVPPGGANLVVTYTDHPSELYLINRLMEKAAQQGFTASMNASYALSENVALTTRSYPNTEEVLNWEIPLHILRHPNISGINISGKAWNLDLTETVIGDDQ